MGLLCGRRCGGHGRHRLGGDRRLRARRQEKHPMTSPRLDGAAEKDRQTPPVPRRGGLALRRVLVGMLFAVVVYGGFALWRGVGKMGSELARFEWWSFAAACALAFANYLVRWLKWEFYLARLEIRGVGRIDSLLTFLSGFVLTVTPGKVGEVFKSLVLFETYDVPIARTAPIVIAERVTDVIGVVLLIAFGSLGLSGGLVWAGLGTVAVLVLLVVVSNRGLSYSLIGAVEKLPGPFRR